MSDEENPPMPIDSHMHVPGDDKATIRNLESKVQELLSAMDKRGGGAGATGGPRAPPGTDIVHSGLRMIQGTIDKHQAYTDKHPVQGGKKPTVLQGLRRDQAKFWEDTKSEYIEWFKDWISDVETALVVPPKKPRAPRTLAAAPPPSASAADDNDDDDEEEDDEEDVDDEKPPPPPTKKRAQQKASKRKAAEELDKTIVRKRGKTIAN